ncbi:MAG: protein kinase, partial [Myxococcota bacterium]
AVVQQHDIVVSPAQTMTPSQVVTLGLAIASALDAAHTHNVLHRDLKPPNVMLLDNGDVRVVDFGIAKILGPNTTGHRLSQVVGTPLFMAPEQFAAGNRIDRRLDIYQLGAVLYFALTGKPPYTTQQGGVSTLVQILEQQRSRIGREGPRPSTHKPALAQTAPVLDALVGRLLSTEVEQRPSSAAEVHELLNACPCRRPGRRTMVEQPLPAVVGSSLSSNTLPERMGSPLQPPPNTPRSIPTAAEPNTPPEPSGGLQLPSRAPPKVGSPPLSPPEGNTPDVLRASPLPGATARQTGTTTSGNSLLKLLLIGGGLVVVCGGLAVVGMIVVTAFMATTVLSEEDCCGEWTDSTIMGAKQLDEHRERGDTYYYGRGQKRDYTKAAESYDRSCRGSMGLGCANLGRLYERGRGVEKSLHNALLLYRRGCIKGHGEACTLAGAMYDEGRGTTRDLLRAAELFEEACETEDAPDGRGCSNLGYMYDKGRGVRRNRGKAVRYYRDGCELGDATGCANLGMMYEHGVGTTQDIQKAFELYEQSCQNYARGCVYLGRMYQRGQAVRKDEERSVLFFEKACTGKDGLGCRELGLMHQEGKGGLKASPDKASELFARSCDYKHSKGCERLRALCAQHPKASGCGS